MITKFHIFESNGNKQWFYHATKSKYLPEIVEHGLTPNIDRETNWKGKLKEWSRGKVFVTACYSTAIFYGQIINNYSKKYYPILRIKMNPNDLIKDPDAIDDWYCEKPITEKFEVEIYENGKEKWVELTPELADKINQGWNGELIQEGLISTTPTKQTVKILKRKFPDYYIGLRDGEGDIEISAGRKEYVSDITQIIGICNQLGWFISFGTKDNKDYNFDDTFTEQTFDEIIIKPLFDTTKDIDIKPSTLYHVTSEKHLNKIFKIGLVPKHEDKLSHHPDRIYVTDELELAWGLKKQFERLYGEDCEILKISTRGLDIQLYSDVDSRQNGFYTLENIPPKFISILPKEEYRKHWKGIQEGYSNYKGLTQIIRDKIDDNWDRIKKKYKGTQFSFNYEKPDKTKNFVIVKFNPKSEGSYIQRDFKSTEDDYIQFYRIVIGTKYKNFEEDKDDIVATLVHEITHFGQKFNKFNDYEDKRHSIIVKRRREQNPGLRLKDYYDLHHDKYKTEKESVMMSFFELLRRKNIKRSTTFCYDSYEYFDLYPYKKLINKMISYGVNINIFYEFKNDLQKILNSYTKRSITFTDDGSKYDTIRKCYILSKQFNFVMKDNLKRIYNTFKFDEPKSYLDYDIIKKDIDSMINDKDLR